MFLFDFFSCHNAEVLILTGYFKFKTKIIPIFNFIPEPGALTVLPRLSLLLKCLALSTIKIVRYDPLR